MNRILLIFSALATVAACASQQSMPDAQEGEALFVENCAACHSYRGEGGTLSGGQHAPNLSEIALRNDGVFPRATVLSKIDGYQHGSDGDQTMPEFGALLSGEQVPVEVDGVMTPTPRTLAALLAYLESIQVKA